MPMCNAIGCGHGARNVHEHHQTGKPRTWKMPSVKMKSDLLFSPFNEIGFNPSPFRTNLPACLACLGCLSVMVEKGLTGPLEARSLVLCHREMPDEEKAYWARSC